MRPLVTVLVEGRARTKGSMVAKQRRVIVGGQSLGVGHAHLSESTKGSKEWRAEVAWEVRKKLRGTRPYAGPVQVSVMAFLPQPPSNRDVEPVAMRTGDVDKIARNVLDALVDAGAIKDDAQVVSLHSLKTWADIPERPYTVIQVETYEEED